MTGRRVFLHDLKFGNVKAVYDDNTATSVAIQPFTNIVIYAMASNISVYLSPDKCQVSLETLPIKVGRNLTSVKTSSKESHMIVLCESHLIQGGATCQLNATCPQMTYSDPISVFASFHQGDLLRINEMKFSSMP